MSAYTQSVTNLTIPSGTADSNILHARIHYADGMALMLYGPASLDAHTFVIQTSRDGSTFVDLQEDIAGTPTDVPPPGAGKSRTYFILAPAMYLRIHDDSGNVAADRTWGVSKVMRTD